ncbi:hypothetical protein [Nonomuraea ferruginea]|uniref:YxiG-like domain-containing protein n=1 Tax=Nonomuraea ferruginea TaxID=46174 RepID=A0ABT4T5D2_9ACTN|nr:hypothetical protein [Nonomuraea ferruginea]MDA0644373.1 hypothetical protein [Nonomuraea ferruginea]
MVLLLEHCRCLEPSLDHLAHVPFPKFVHRLRASAEQDLALALLRHGFVGYSRDYQLVVLPMPDPRTGTTPPPLRYLFRYCVQATCTTALPARTWRVSLDDRLTTCETRVEYDGYVWGVKWQALYPGATLISDSPTARSWAAAIGIDFHEVRFETNVHVLTLVFSDLHIEELPPPPPGHGHQFPVQ